MKLYCPLIPQHYYNLSFFEYLGNKKVALDSAMSEFSLILVLQKKQENPTIGIANIQIKSEKLTPFGGFFSIMGQFDSTLSSVIDSALDLRCRSFGCRYSEIIRSLMSIYFFGGSCIEDVATHLMNHLSLHPTLRACSSDTILRAIKELTKENVSYTSDAGKNYDFNTADTLNSLLLMYVCIWSTERGRDV